MTLVSIHQSTLHTLCKCGLRYDFRYNQGIRAAPGVATVRGKGCHAAIEENLDHKINTGALLEVAEVAELAANGFDATWDGEEPVLLPEEVEEGIGKVKGRAKDAAVACAVTHAEEIAPHMAPKHVEREFRVTFPDREYEIGGTIDIQEEILDDGTVFRTIRDTKTTGKGPDPNAAHDSLQLSVYSLGLFALEGTLPDRVALDYLVKTKTKPPRVDTKWSTRTKDHLRQAVELADTAYAMIKAGIFLPAPEGSWWCSEKWCGYWNEVCPHGRRSRVMAQSVHAEASVAQFEMGSGLPWRDDPKAFTKPLPALMDPRDVDPPKSNKENSGLPWRDRPEKFLGVKK